MCDSAQITSLVSLKLSTNALEVFKRQRLDCRQDCRSVWSICGCAWRPGICFEKENITDSWSCSGTLTKLRCAPMLKEPRLRIRRQNRRANCSAIQVRTLQSLEVLRISIIRLSKDSYRQYKRRESTPCFASCVPLASDISADVLLAERQTHISWTSICTPRRAGLSLKDAYMVNEACIPEPGKFEDQILHKAWWKSLRQGWIECAISDKESSVYKEVSGQAEIEWGIINQKSKNTGTNCSPEISCQVSWLSKGSGAIKKTAEAATKMRMIAMEMLQLDRQRSMIALFSFGNQWRYEGVFSTALPNEAAEELWKAKW